MTWLFGNYGRLSKDEKGEKADSKEIQLKFNAEYIKSHQMGTIVGTYFDDDVSGSVFEREDLDRLKEDINSGKVNAVVVKDLSRLGRSNAKTLTLIEYLEERNVRLVAINDNFDSLKDNDDLIGIKTWYNERYIKDISVKIRSNVHQKLKEGQYLGTPPYGYKKEYQLINNKLKSVNHLLVDEKVGSVIVEIFDLYIRGNGYRSVARIIEERGYPNPSRYKDFNRPQSECWTADHIRRIIKNRVYCGDTVQGVSERVSYKSKKTRRRPADKWYVKQNTHEPIVDRETWTLANEINKRRLGKNGPGTKKAVYLFSGIIQCGACGKPLCARKVKDKPLGYICSTYFHFGKKRVDKKTGCDSHYVRHEILEDAIRRDLFSQMRPEHIESAVNACRERLLAKKDHAKTIFNLSQEIRKLEQQLKLAYEDRLNQVISVSFFQEKKRDIEKKIKCLQQQVDTLEKETLQRQKAALNNTRLNEIFYEAFQNCKLTRELLKMAVKKIHVFLPGDIRQENKSSVQAELGTDLDTVDRLFREGGIFIEYNFKKE